MFKVRGAQVERQSDSSSSRDGVDVVAGERKEALQRNARCPLCVSVNRAEAMEEERKSGDETGTVRGRGDSGAQAAKQTVQRNARRTASATAAAATATAAQQLTSYCADWMQALALLPSKQAGNRCRKGATGCRLLLSPTLSLSLQQQRAFRLTCAIKQWLRI